MLYFTTDFLDVISLVSFFVYMKYYFSSSLFVLFAFFDWPASGPCGLGVSRIFAMRSIGKNPTHTGGYGASAKILRIQVDLEEWQKSCAHRWI